MAEFNSSKNNFNLTISGDYVNSLDMIGFSRMMKNPSYCYKFYWLEAIVQLVSRGITIATFDELINEMICSAWYSVRAFHVHLSGIPSDGKIKDALELSVKRLAELSDLAPNADYEEIKTAIKAHEKELRTTKEQLTNMVPYYALSGFFMDSERYDDWRKQTSDSRKVAYINAFNREVRMLPYVLGESSKLKKEIAFSKPWIQMIRDNEAAIRGWIQYEKVQWLQNNNPEVPGLVYKLSRPDEKVRKLDKVRSLWDGILNLCEIENVFINEPVNPNNYDVDHFIPWSFVMNDELWNLMPMDSALNNKKLAKLPEWDPFFCRFARNQYLMYGFIHEKPEIHKRFEACFRDNLHSIWAGQELYRPGNSETEFYNILKKNMQPVYDSARRQGYELWNIVS